MWLARKVRNPLRRLKLATKQRLGWLDVPQILVYRSFAHQGDFCVQGHVIESAGLARPQPRHTRWQNALAMLKRYASDYIPGMGVQLHYGAQTLETETDEEGYFEAHFRAEPDDQVAWQSLRCALLYDVVAAQPDVEASGEVLTPSTLCRFGVISDVDDTILISHATDALRKIRLLLFKNAFTRLPFKGVAAFYWALHRGPEGRCQNPIFYVSSSEWNLYDLLVDFCEYWGLPKGPFLLQDRKRSLRDLWRSGGGHHTHKLDKMRRILHTFDTLPFVLIGDSGQRDAELYTQLTREFPDRVVAIYIRDVGKRRREPYIRRLIEEVQAMGTEMRLTPDSEQAARHALARGFIQARGLEEVLREKRTTVPAALGL